MGAFTDVMRNLGPMRLAMMGAVAMLLIGFFIFFITRLDTAAMTLLYGDLSTTDSSRMVSQLEQMNVPYELRQNGTQILVPEDRVLRLRLTMAEQGLPRGGSIGYEIFDKTESLGTTNFMQNVNLVRALEGELARTISTLNPVRAARVHIVMPRRELFSRNQQEPSASVILTMGGPGQLGAEQIAAIQHLTAAAVPGLQPNRISIVDDKGKLLARGFDGDDVTGLMAAKSEERKRNFESHLARTIQQLLEKSVGYGKVQAEVTAEMDFDRVNTNEEIFDPEGQVVRSTQTVESSTNTREADTPPVSVATNLPDANAGLGDGASSSSVESRTEETVKFEVTKRVVNHVREAGIVKRLSVAVLIDGRYSKNEQTGDMIYAERPQAEMDKLATLVRSAVGFNGDRGDIIEVVNMPFAGAEAPPEEPLQLFFGFDKHDLLKMAQTLFLGIVGILVVLLVIRPLVSRFFDVLPQITGAAQAEAQMLADQAAGTPALAGPGGVGGEQGFEELIDIDRVEGRVKASSVKKVGEIVSKHPEEAISIVRAWMYQES